MRYLLFSVSFFILSATQAQEDSTSALGPWQFGCSFSGDYGYRKLYDTNGNLGSVVEGRNEQETPKYSYTTGVNALYNFNDQIALGFGVLYSNKGYKMEIDNLTFSSGEQTEIVKLKTLYNMQYIDVPVNVNMSLGNKKIRFVGAAGIVANFFIGETDRTIIYFQDRREYFTNSPDYDFNKVNLTATVSAGISYQMNESTTLRLEPTFRYGLTKIMDAPISATLFSAGLNLSYFTSFGNDQKE